MIVLSGADLVLPDRLLPNGSLIIDGDRIAAIEPRPIDAAAGATRLDGSGTLVVPGFIDVHVHGLEGHDVLDGGDALAEVASRLPRYGVTAFCPTTLACPPADLRVLLTAVTTARTRRTGPAARVLRAHLESNFINPDYRGAQPLSCLRTPSSRGDESDRPPRDAPHFTGADIHSVLREQREAIGIVTLAPELDGGLDLVRDLTAAGHLVSIGHSGATFEEAHAAVDAGVRHATHLFNRMTPLSHRAPGVPGCVLQREEVRAELICDGFHVHPAMIQLAYRAKGVDGLMAITDGTAGSGLPVGSRTHLGSHTILVTGRTAELEDGTLAGSVATMDAIFRQLVRQVGLRPVDAAHLCATTPARQLGLHDTGRLAPGAIADLVVLDRELQVLETFVAGVRWNPRVGAVV